MRHLDAFIGDKRQAGHGLGVFKDVAEGATERSGHAAESRVHQDLGEPGAHELGTDFGLADAVEIFSDDIKTRADKAVDFADFKSELLDRLVGRGQRRNARPQPGGAKADGAADRTLTPDDGGHRLFRDAVLQRADDALRMKMGQ